MCYVLIPLVSLSWGRVAFDDGQRGGGGKTWAGKHAYLDKFYVQAKAIVDSYLNATDVRATLLQALAALDQAVRRDPNFVSAYCYIARANALLFFFDLDPTPERIVLAENAVDTALRLRPDSPEAHFARGDFLSLPA